MTLEEIWTELAANEASERATGRRRIHADSAVDLNLTLAPGIIRGLMLTVGEPSMNGLEDLPATRAIEHRRHTAGGGLASLELRLVDHAASDLFAALATDVAENTARARNDDEAVGRWITRIARWQRLMAIAPRGLGPEKQRGLYAELHVLRTHLAPRIGIDATVGGWEGPAGGHDFQLRGGSLEVKSAASHEPQVVTINGERQLDETGTDGLHLVHISLDVHLHAGETLPEMVAAVRELCLDSSVAVALEDRLLDAGYADVHENRYRPTGYTVREENFLSVGPGFPRLIEAELPEGIGGVRYGLVIAACLEFRVEPDVALAAVEQGHGG